MHTIYSILTRIASLALRVSAWFSPKMKLFTKGRRTVWSYLEQERDPNAPLLWMHVASLGEYEQGLPILKGLRATYPEHQILLTFFSPSGYEVRKNSPFADLVCYLPLDTLGNAKKFIKLTRPKLALFVKYELWPNYLRYLEQQQVPILLVSAIFSKRQVYFKPWGRFMRNALRRIDHIFVQDEGSAHLLQELGLKEVSISGDTRFDRVAEIAKEALELDFMASFTNGHACVVAGSTWPEDEQLLVPYINNSSKTVKFVIAPHNIKTAHIDTLVTALGKKVVRYSQLEDESIDAYEVLIVDTIGLLTQIYRYADMAYVGGGFATGLHNTLEPAVFGIPVLIGPQFKGFKEAEDLVAKKGLLVVTDAKEFETTLDHCLDDAHFARMTGNINAEYVGQRQGATKKVLAYVKGLL
ncbi:glycosyltransferase N-terminal domain-containing protein [Flagellimonas sp. DF-77]|uniref:3-deoxy-D-manno-octulosonic acid transferase n=1 Tax=Flagellimonas algarum TaxID=3230298 RepID=UPI00339AA95F